MPLIKSSSKEAFKENLRKELKAGKGQKQAAAIAYSVQEKARHDRRLDKKDNPDKDS